MIGEPVPAVDLVIPTTGRPSLGRLLEALAGGDRPLPGRVLLVDDRPEKDGPLISSGVPAALVERVSVLRGRAAGPAAARNTGWRASEAEWISFLDDDVLPEKDWCQRLLEDLGRLGPKAAGSQGRLRVPLREDRRPTDWERNVKGLEGALWITADLAYRRRVLAEIGGFDERFPRAYREDTDLGLRVTRAGYSIERGSRRVTHPVRPAGRMVSVKLQAGNADDVLMNALHGPRWREEAGAAPGRRPRHIAITIAGIAGLLGLISRRRRLAAAGLLGWLAGTVELTWTRISPGPRTAGEVATMLATSALIPPAAAFHWVSGMLRSRRLLSQDPDSSRPEKKILPQAVLLDRDGTLIQDVPYNGDPERVVPMPGAKLALDRLRSAEIPLAVVSNQSGVARGLITRDQVEAVNRRVEELLGPLGPWEVCVHGPEEGCTCRKPAPGLVLRAAETLGVDPERCVVIGDIGPDVVAARTAGARGILVPTPQTRPAEVLAASEVAPNINRAVDLILGERP